MAAVTAIAAAAAAAAFLFGGGGGRAAPRSGAPGPTSPGAALGAQANPPAPVPTGYGLGRPLIAHGLRLIVFFDPPLPWTRVAPRHLPRGTRWAFVELLIRNLAYAGVAPYRLSLVLRDAGNVDHHPVATVGSGALLGSSRPLALGGLLKIRLGFLVPRAASGLVFRIGPIAGTGGTIDVPLGQ